MGTIPVTPWAIIYVRPGPLIRYGTGVNHYKMWLDIVIKFVKQFVKGKGFLVCDVRVAAHTQNCPRNGPLNVSLLIIVLPRIPYL